HLRDTLFARPGEPLATDPDAVADRRALAEHVVEVGVTSVDDDGAGRLLGAVLNELTAKGRGQLARSTLLRPIIGRQCSEAFVALARGCGRLIARLRPVARWRAIAWLRLRAVALLHAGALRLAIAIALLRTGAWRRAVALLRAITRLRAIT